MNLSRLEQYLDELERPLAGLSEGVRSEWREEARQHVLGLAAAHEELGSSPDEALEAALRQFGNARRIGEQVRQFSLGQDLDGKTAFTLFSAPVIVTLILMIGLNYWYAWSSSDAALRAMALTGAQMFIAVPVIGGWRVGRRIRTARRKMRPLCGLLLSVLLSVPIASLYVLPILGFGQGPGNLYLDWRWGLLWLPMASLSAALANRWERRRTARL
jgi:hypothetical protein